MEFQAATAGCRESRGDPSGDELVLSAASGSPMSSTGAPLTTGQLFRIASHSKTFTATAVLQLVEAGRLRLDDPIADWVPALAGTALAEVTVRELLGHQGGVVRDGRDADHWQLCTRSPTPTRLDRGRARGARCCPQRALQVLEHRLLAARPGDRGGHRHRVRRPRAGRRGRPARADRHRRRRRPRPGRRVRGRPHRPARRRGRRETLPHVDTRAMAAATGFTSTAEDLAATGRPTSSATAPAQRRSKRLMQRLESVVPPTAPRRAVRARHGLWTLGDRNLIGHSGGYPGHITLTLVDPAESWSSASSRTPSTARPKTSRWAGQADRRRAEAARGRGATTGRLPPPAIVTGRFASLWGVGTSPNLGGRLVLVRPTATDPLPTVEELEVVDATTLRVAAQPSFGPAGELVPLERDAAGRIVSLRLGGVTSRPIDDYRRGRTAIREAS